MKLSIVIPNRNDSVMLAITVRSVLEALKSIEDSGEIVIVDNSDGDIWKILSTVNVSPLPLAYVKSGKIQLIQQKFPSLYSARQTAIESAKGEYVYNVDSHIMIGEGQFKDLIGFMENRPPKCGFGFAPIGWVGNHEWIARHDIRTDKEGIFGSWGRRYYKPTKICWNFGSCICNREWYLREHGGLDFFATDRLSWGGGEFYSAMKCNLLGYENWAIPTSPQYHIGPFSREVQSIGNGYRLYGNSGYGQVGIGILAAFYALGGDDAKEEASKANEGLKQQYGISTETHWDEARKLAKDTWNKNKQRFKISFKDFIKRQGWANQWKGWKFKDEWRASQC